MPATCSYSLEMQIREWMCFYTSFIDCCVAVMKLKSGIQTAEQLHQESQSLSEWVLRLPHAQTLLTVRMVFKPSVSSALVLQTYYSKWLPIPSFTFLHTVCYLILWPNTWQHVNTVSVICRVWAGSSCTATTPPLRSAGICSLKTCFI